MGEAGEGEGETRKWKRKWQSTMAWHGAHEKTQQRMGREWTWRMAERMDAVRLVGTVQMEWT